MNKYICRINKNYHCIDVQHDKILLKIFVDLFSKGGHKKERKKIVNKISFYTSNAAPKIIDDQAKIRLAKF